MHMCRLTNHFIEQGWLTAIGYKQGAKQAKWQRPCPTLGRKGGEMGGGETGR